MIKMLQKVLKLLNKNVKIKIVILIYVIILLGKLDPLMKDKLFFIIALNVEPDLCLIIKKYNF